MHLEELGREPVSNESPAGQDARYDPDYAQLQGEIDKLNSVTNIADVNWKRVVDLGSGILAAKSKDLLVAVYTCVGLTHDAGLEGLASGTQFLRNMVDTFWEDAFPPKNRLRGRMNAFSWWQEKTVVWVKKLPSDQAVPRELHQRIIENVQALDQVLGQVMPDLPPMRDLLNALNRLPVERSPRSDPQEMEQQGNLSEKTDQSDDHNTVQKKQPTEQGRSETAPAGSERGILPENVNAARKVLIEAAVNFAILGRAENLADPWVWKATRMAAWINLKALPPAQGGLTMIPAPDTIIKTALHKQLSDGKLREAAMQAESHFPGSIFWLDLQCIIAKALAGLGDEFAAAADVVRGETQALVQRFRGLEQFCFADGTPFADPETRAWINSLATQGHHGPEQAGETSRQDGLVQTAREQAESRFVKKDEAGALDVLSKARETTRNGPVAMRLRMLQVAFMCRAGRFALATALAEELLGEIEIRGLETWDPVLAVQALQGCQEAFVGLGGEKNLTISRELTARIARLHPSAALNLPA
ncbi:type VI secretion system protein TssA [Desulfonatronum parangueonense]